LSKKKRRKGRQKQRLKENKKLNRGLSNREWKTKRGEKRNKKDRMRQLLPKETQSTTFRVRWSLLILSRTRRVSRTMKCTKEVKRESSSLKTPLRQARASWILQKYILISTNSKKRKVGWLKWPLTDSRELLTGDCVTIAG